MKKILVALMLVLVLSLSGCDADNPKLEPKGWALQYAEEQYEYDYGGYTLIAYDVKQLSIYQGLESDFEFYEIFEITFVNDSGKSIIYNVFIAYDNNMWKYISEDNILDVDIMEEDNG